VGIDGDQAHSVESAGDEVGEERVPCCGGLAGRDLHSEAPAVLVVVHPGRDQHDRIDHASALADFKRQRVACDERVRAGLAQGW